MKHNTLLNLALTLAVVLMAAGMGTGLSYMAVSAAENPPESGIERPQKDEEKENKEEKPEAPVIKPTTGGLKGGCEEAVKYGRLPGFEDKDINTDPDSFKYLLNRDMTFESPTAVGNIMVENDPGNLAPMQMSIYLDGSEQLVYTSAIIKPGYHINGDKLIGKLKKGDYKASAVISVYDRDTMELKTSFYEEVTLHVKSKLFGIF